MKFRLLPVVIAIVLPCLAYYCFLSPTATAVSALQTRIELASTQADTIAAGSVIRPRITRERALIAARLVRVRSFTVPQAEARFLNDLSYLAKAYGVRLVSVASKGKPVLFGSSAIAQSAKLTASEGRRSSITPFAGISRPPMK